MEEENIPQRSLKGVKSAPTRGGKVKPGRYEPPMLTEPTESHLPHETTANYNVKYSLWQIELYRTHPERKKYLKESLKNYLLIKNNIYLNRSRKLPTEDDILKCECVKSDNLPR